MMGGTEKGQGGEASYFDFLCSDEPSLQLIPEDTHDVSKHNAADEEFDAPSFMNVSGPVEMPSPRFASDEDGKLPSPVRSRVEGDTSRSDRDRQSYSIDVSLTDSAERDDENAEVWCSWLPSRVRALEAQLTIAEQELIRRIKSNGTTEHETATG